MLPVEIVVCAFSLGTTEPASTNNRKRQGRKLKAIPESRVRLNDWELSKLRREQLSTTIYTILLQIALVQIVKAN
jgi:hypothetical protein